MPRYDFKDVESEVKEYWEEEGIPEELAEFGGDSEDKFYLLDGPPFVNGKAHAGHAMTITFKDVWAKLKEMQGYDVHYQPGFDCHGLPIEVKVEEEMGIESKKEIEEMGAEKFMDRCREFATGNIEEWMELFKDMATWKGWLDPYLTFKDYYLESGWWTIKQLADKGMLYRGEKPIHWCPRCETALAGYEASDEYQEIEDKAVYIKFQLKNREEKLLAWTTTPWTLPANVALLVHPDETYAKVRMGREELILAKPLLEEIADKMDAGYTVLEEFPGSELEGLKYEPLIDCGVQEELEDDDNAHRVYVSVPIMLERTASGVAEKKGEEAGEEFGHLVSMDQGTGIVHIAPGHGAEDNELGDHYDLPAPSPLDDSCHFTEGAGFEGYVRDANPEIVEWLRRNGKLLHEEDVSHSYPHCWRCKSPLIFRVSDQWFLSIDTIKDKMFGANEETEWLPDFAEERMHNHLEESPDWCISTQRYWGIPLPVWVCGECESHDVIGGQSELEERMTNGVKLTDLHKDVVDEVKIECDCGGEMERVPDTLNVWVDSGIAPWASLGYPHQNEELFEELWNIDLIDESQDQIRGWFYSLLFMGIATFDERPYETVCLNGWVLDAEGKKMSTSLGNVIDAHDMVEDLGADVTRWYLCNGSAPWGVRKFSVEEARELERQMDVLLNVVKFVEMYGLTPEASDEIGGKANEWIASQVNGLVRDVTEELEEFNFHRAGRDLAEFLLEDFSRTYMKLAKEGDQKEVEKTLGYVMDRYLRLLAPVCPYITEHIYQELFSNWHGDTVHGLDWPEADGKMMDEELEEAFAVMDSLSEAALALRQQEGIGLRYPVQAVTVSGPDELKQGVEEIEDIIKELLNVKEVRMGEASKEYRVKLDYSEVGPKYGDDVGEIEELLAEADHGEVAEEVEREGKVSLGGFELTEEELKIEVEMESGRSFSTPYGHGTVQLDTERTQEIREESFVRELSRAVQERRKEMGLDIRDRVTLRLRADGDSKEVLERWREEVGEETGSEEVEFTEDLEDVGEAKYGEWSAEFDVEA